jgi:sulfatase maturation enzyme AslB (radical SAM superfamily)
MADMSKCSAFWVHTNIRPGNRIFPCCRFKRPIATFTGDVSAVLHIEEYDKLREGSLNGVQFPECEKCYTEENQGKESLRQKFNKEYSTNKVELKFLEIGFDNICNLACDGCWEEWSSTWANIKNPTNKKINILTTTEFINLPKSIDKILFLGGEPLMTNKHIRFLKEISNPENVSVIYYTNGTFLLSEKEILVLNAFKSVKIYVSIDGVADLNEKVRKGSKWTDIIKFLEQLKSTSFSVEINSVLHVNNWHGIKELANFINQNQYVWNTNILTYPKKLDIVNLSEMEKTQFSSLLNDITIPNKEYILRHLYGLREV